MWRGRVSTKVARGDMEKNSVGAQVRRWTHKAIKAESQNVLKYPSMGVNLLEMLYFFSLLVHSVLIHNKSHACLIAALQNLVFCLIKQ